MLKISVITPSFNSARFIEKAIQSVLTQQYPNFEHIIIDGDSQDGTLEILTKYPHLCWISEPDHGQSDAMNKGFKMAVGDVIVYLNSDDYFEPGAFHTAIKYLESDLSYKFVVGAVRTVDADGTPLQEFIDLHNRIRVTFFEMLQWWRYSFPTNPSSYFYYREVQDKVGEFDTSDHYSMDYDFLLLCALHFQFKKVSEVFGNFRYFPGTKTYSSSHSSAWVTRLMRSQKFWRFLPYHQRLYLYWSRTFWLFKQRVKQILYRTKI